MWIERSLRDSLDQSYPIIHIVSHFQFTPGSMDDSFLLLGDGTHLSLAQIKLDFNSVELLTLSACETAVGDDSTAALMRALYQAHKVDHLDKADALRQAQLALLRGSVGGDDTANAASGLARANTARVSASFKTNAAAPYAHPFFWAPFILMGNWL
jgi:CHAT domain-containing protein